METKQTRQARGGSSILILLALVLLACLLTYLVPAGQYQRAEDAATGQMVVEPGSYAPAAQTPVAPWLIPLKVVETLGGKSTATLLAFIFIVGGAFEVVTQSGCIESLCGVVIRAFQNRRRLIIPAFLCLFSVFGFSMGLTTASIVFVPIGIAVAGALGFDEITGMAMVMLGTNVGFTAGMFNPFSVGIAQSIADVPLFSGAWLRWVSLAVLLPLTIWYILHRAKKTAVLPPAAAGETLREIAREEAAKAPFTLRQGLVLGLLALALGVIMAGVGAFGWEIPHIAAVFLVLAAAAGAAGGLGFGGTCAAFTAGCRKMMGGALVIGTAATMRTILVEGNILDSIAHGLIGGVAGLPGWAQLVGMFWANALLDPLITSGSAHAAVAMPVMVPMADALGLSRQAAVFAFQMGDGLPNLVSPISTTLTSCLAVSGLAYPKWLRWFLPLVGLYMLAGTALVVFAGLCGY